MITEIDITFGKSNYLSQTSNYQDILINGEVIGSLETKITGVITETYTFGIDKKDIEKFSNVSESEDIGWYFVNFKTLEDFIEGYNSLEIKNER